MLTWALFRLHRCTSCSLEVAVAVAALLLGERALLPTQTHTQAHQSQALPDNTTLPYLEEWHPLMDIRNRSFS